MANSTFGTFNRPGTIADQASFDAGLRAHMVRVYNYMASGLALTGIVLAALVGVAQHDADGLEEQHLGQRLLVQSAKEGGVVLDAAAADANGVDGGRFDELMGGPDGEEERLHEEPAFDDACDPVADGDDGGGGHGWLSLGAGRGGR